MPGDERGDEGAGLRSIAVVEPWSTDRVAVAPRDDPGLVGRPDIATTGRLEPVTGAGFTGVLGAADPVFRPRRSLPALTWPELARLLGSDRPAESERAGTDTRRRETVERVGETGRTRRSADAAGPEPSTDATDETGRRTGVTTGQGVSRTAPVQRVSRVARPRLELPVVRQGSTAGGRDGPDGSDGPGGRDGPAGRDRTRARAGGSSADAPTRREADRVARVFPDRDETAVRPDRPAARVDVDRARGSGPAAGPDRATSGRVDHDISVTTPRTRTGPDSRAGRGGRERARPDADPTAGAGRGGEWRPVFRRPAPPDRESGPDGETAPGPPERPPPADRTPESARRRERTTGPRREQAVRGPDAADPRPVATGERPRAIADAPGPPEPAPAGGREPRLTRLVTERGYDRAAPNEPSGERARGDTAVGHGPTAPAGSGPRGGPDADGPTSRPASGRASEGATSRPARRRSPPGRLQPETVRRRVRPPVTAAAPAGRPERRGPGARAARRRLPSLDLATRRRVTRGATARAGGVDRDRRRPGRRTGEPTADSATGPPAGESETGQRPGEAAAAPRTPAREVPDTARAVAFPEPAPVGRVGLDPLATSRDPSATPTTRPAGEVGADTGVGRSTFPSLDLATRRRVARAAESDGPDGRRSTAGDRVADSGATQSTPGDRAADSPGTPGGVSPDPGRRVAFPDPGRATPATDPSPVVGGVDPSASPTAPGARQPGGRAGAGVARSTFPSLDLVTRRRVARASRGTAAGGPGGPGDRTPDSGTAAGPDDAGAALDRRGAGLTQVTGADGQPARSGVGAGTAGGPGTFPSLDLVTRRRVARASAGGAVGGPGDATEVESAGVTRPGRARPGDPGGDGSPGGPAAGHGVRTVFATPGSERAQSGKEPSAPPSDVEPSQRQEVTQMPALTLRSQRATGDGTATGQSEGSTGASGTGGTRASNGTDATGPAGDGTDATDGTRGPGERGRASANAETAQRDAELVSAILDSNAGFVSHDPTVDQFVDNLYEAIKRKMEEERQRGGL